MIHIQQPKSHGFTQNDMDKIALAAVFYCRQAKLGIKNASEVVAEIRAAIDGCNSPPVADFRPGLPGWLTVSLLERTLDKGITERAQPNGDILDRDLIELFTGCNAKSVVIQNYTVELGGRLVDIAIVRDLDAEIPSALSSMLPYEFELSVSGDKITLFPMLNGSRGGADDGR